jgi:glutamate/tyrosine decarboxylase-like PLP-dependent enzyme
MGEDGYLQAAKQIMETSTWIKDQMDSISEIEVLGEPTFVIAFASESLNIYQVMEFMTQKGWGLNGLHLPPCVHLCVTLRHTQPGVKERFITDLKEAVQHVRDNPQASQGIGPVYGLASSPDLRGMVTEVLNWYLDKQFEV